MEWVTVLAAVLGASGIAGLVNATVGPWSRRGALSKRMKSHRAALRGAKDDSIESAALQRALKTDRLELASLTLIRLEQWQRLLIFTITMLALLVVVGLITLVAPTTPLERLINTLYLFGGVLWVVGCSTLATKSYLLAKREAFVRTALSENIPDRDGATTRDVIRLSPSGAAIARKLATTASDSTASQ